MRAFRATRAVTCIALASALCVPASAAQVDFFLKIPGVPGESRDKDHKNWINVESVAWSTHRPGAAKGGNVEYEWKVEEGESAPPPPGEAEITLKGSAAPARPKVSDVTLKRGTMAAEPAAAAGSDRPMGWDNTRQKKLAALRAPPARGTFRARTAPWPGCRVGARYPQLQLGAGGKLYTLGDVRVASCGRAAGDADDRPTEEVAFYYNKVTVRGWDPEKKEE